MNSIPLRFPSDTERIREDVAAVCDWSPERRLLALKQLLSAVTSFAATRETRQNDRLREADEEQWQRCMSDFIQRQLAR